MSGNPGGRPKGPVRRIREETEDGGELAAFMLRVFRDESEPTKTRMQAADWLADRGYGRPATVIDAEIRQDDSESHRRDYATFLTTLTDAQLAYLIQLRRDAETEAVSDGGPVAALPAAT